MELHTDNAIDCLHMPRPAAVSCGCGVLRGTLLAAREGLSAHPLYTGIGLYATVVMKTWTTF